MSKSLCWEPILPHKYKTLPDELKFILRDKYSLEDGGSKLNSASIPYLEGLKDANIKGADELINAINKYGNISIYLY